MNHSDRANGGFRAKDLNGPIAPSRLLRSKELTSAQKLVWLAIRDREGSNDDAWPSINRIADDSGLGRQTIIDAVNGVITRGARKSRKGLEETGWLAVKRTHGEVNRYECWLPVRKVDYPSTDTVPQASTVSVPKPIHPKPTKEPTHAQGFDNFWKSYPKKMGKKKARKNWSKIKMTPELLEKIMKSVAEQCKTQGWTKDGGKYIPYPEGWLNNERWNDEIDLESEAKVTEDKKKSFIDGDKAYKKKDGTWMVITHTGQHCEYTGPLDKVEWK